MHEPELSGVCPIVDTPFTESGAVDFDSLEFLVDTLIANGCHALALFGYASEFYKLSDREREEMAELVIERCEAGGVPSVISVTPQATRIAVEEAKGYEDMGADALMVLPPSVRGPPADAVYDHLAAIGEAVSLPVMIQYAPGSTGVSYPPEFFARLYREVENVDYFKIECAPPGQYVSKLLELTDGSANVLVGRAGYEMIESFDRGAIGVMPASAMYDIYLQIYDRYHAGDREGAIDIHSDLVAMLNQLTKVGIQFEKRILARRGLAKSEHCRAPEARPDEPYDAIFDEYYERYVRPHIDTSHTIQNAD